MLPFLSSTEQRTTTQVEALVQLGEKIERGFAKHLVRAADPGRFGNDPWAIEHNGGLSAHCSTGSTHIE